ASRRAASPTTSTSGGSRTNGSTTSWTSSTRYGRRHNRGSMPLIPVPAPYDFALSTERFRAFGPDLANLWHEGGIHRVVEGRELRIESAPGGVDVAPFDAETEPVARAMVGADFDLGAFYVWAEQDEVLGTLVERLAGLRPPLAPDPPARPLARVRQSAPPPAGLALRGFGRPNPSGGGVRPPRRLRPRVPAARRDGAGRGGGVAPPRLLPPQGRVRDRSRSGRRRL